MTGVSIFLLGAVAVCNVGFVGYLLLDRNRKIKAPEEENAEEENQAPDAQTPKPMVGKSTFNIDEAMQSSIDRMVQEAVNRHLPEAFEKILGDVRLKDVEFSNEADKPNQAEIEKDEAENTGNFRRMTDEEEAKAFEDARIDEVEPDTVAAPSASGDTLEEIEESMNIAINPDSSESDRARAGKVLEKLLDTNLMDHFTSDEEIYRNVLICVKESIKSDINDKSKPVHKKKATVIVSTNLDDFDPADLLK